MQCKAKAKSSGEQCRRRAVTGREVCSTHGGRTPRGIASPHFKTGRYSKDLPTNLRGMYDDAYNDPELTSLRADLALYAVHAGERIKRLSTGENANLWHSLQSQWNAYTSDKSNEQQQAYALQRIGELIESGAEVERAWMDLYVTLEQRRKTAESEHKREVALKTMVSAEELAVFMARFTTEVVRIVSDPKERAALGEVVIELMGKEKA